MGLFESGEWLSEPLWNQEAVDQAALELTKLRMVVRHYAERSARVHLVCHPKSVGISALAIYEYPSEFRTATFIGGDGLGEVVSAIDEGFLTSNKTPVLMIDRPDSGGSDESRA